MERLSRDGFKWDRVRPRPPGAALWDGGSVQRPLREPVGFAAAQRRPSDDEKNELVKENGRKLET